MHLLGQAVVVDGDHSTAIPLTLQGVLGHLVIDSTVARERLLEELWPDAPPDRAGRRLNTAIWRLRRLLGPDAIHTSSSGALTIDCDAISCDVVGFERALGADVVEREALDLYGGDLLPDRYDDWTIIQRERLRRRYIDALAALVKHNETGGDVGAALEWAERLVTCDELREDGHRRLMRLYASAGRRADALRQFDRCREVLRRELGMEPMQETVLLAAAVREGFDLESYGGPDAGEALSVLLSEADKAFSELHSALSSCRSTLRSLERAVASIPGVARKPPSAAGPRTPRGS